MVKKNKGFTLIELIVTIAIAGIIFSTLISIFPLFTRLNITADDLAQAQELAQMKLKAIESQLQFANTLKIESGLPDTRSDTYHYLYVNAGKIKIISNGSAAAALTSDRSFEDYNYTVNFSPVNAKVIRVDLTVLKNEQQLYKISSDLYVNNLITENITGGTNGSCVTYKISGISVTRISVTTPDDVSSILSSGKTLQMGAVITPANAANSKVQWSVDSDNACASISPQGLLTPLKNGIATVKAAALDGSAVSGTKVITIKNQVIVQSLNLTTETGEESLQVGGHQLQIIPNILPVEAKDNDIIWNVSNSALASISQSGVLTSRTTADTSVIVTATTNDGSKITATIEMLIVVG